MWAAQEGHAEVARLLLERGAESVEDDVMTGHRLEIDVASLLLTCRLGSRHSFKPVKMAIWVL